ncbi:tRNA1(Val) (adenine(37)-N6)-methyltransferase [Ekhidna sp.]
MPNDYFQFKQFKINQASVGMKVTTDGCLFGAWVANEIMNLEEEPQRILDIGSGTGLLSLMIAQNTFNSQIDSVESNSQAFRKSQENFNSSQWANRLLCTHTKVQDYNSGAYDIIVSNPPFFKESEKGQNPNKNQAVHASDLDSKTLLNHVMRLLSPDGIFYLLYPEREMNDFITFAKENGLYLSKLVTVKNQTVGKVFRYMAAFKSSNIKSEKIEIVIRENSGQYTAKFWSLIKEFYLEYNAPKAN